MDYAQEVDAKVIMVASALDGFFAAGANIKHMSAVDQASFESTATRCAARWSAWRPCP